MPTKPLTIEFDPAYIARVLRWAGIVANVSDDPETGYFIEALDGKGDVNLDRLLSALILAYIDAGQPTRTIMEGDPVYIAPVDEPRRDEWPRAAGDANDPEWDE